MLFNPDASSNNYLIVPTIKVPWRCRDALVHATRINPSTSTWLRVCHYLNPTSAFPGSEYATFEEYYLRKCGIQIQNLTQNLLDVDHTSARLNFLTPRYVNRKELCAIHPFPASLWRKALDLPCILYRVNALLLADQIRRTVAVTLNLGKTSKWPPLNFGWSLSDVLKKSREEERRKQEEKLKLLEQKAEEKLQELQIVEIVQDGPAEGEAESKSESTAGDSDGEQAPNGNRWIEIGTWCNEMAESAQCAAANSMWGGLRIEFTGDHQAEAVEDEPEESKAFHLFGDSKAWKIEDDSELTERLRKDFHRACAKNRERILSSKILVKSGETFQKNSNRTKCTEANFKMKLDSYDFNKLLIDVLKYLNRQMFPWTKQMGTDAMRQEDWRSVLTSSPTWTSTQVPALTCCCKL
ncbi:hypothetical protein NQ318_003585 [Aromia moschata]|uniref:PAZ domain-containing protein n=1 Tax=Aromia moschata TaxID=1265417 RepID=A0AAV8YWG0_9CUCU|nr:hypothetical protein NQ318_003585 [Aromia moschata]